MELNIKELLTMRFENNEFDQTKSTSFRNEEIMLPSCWELWECNQCVDKDGSANTEYWNFQKTFDSVATQVDRVVKKVYGTLAFIGQGI